MYGLRSSKVRVDRMENNNTANARATRNAARRLAMYNRNQRGRYAPWNLANNAARAGRNRLTRRNKKNKNNANARGTRNAARRYAKLMSNMRGNNFGAVPRSAAREARWRGHAANLNENTSW